MALIGTFILIVYNENIYIYKHVSIYFYLYMCVKMKSKNIIHHHLVEELFLRGISNNPINQSTLASAITVLLWRCEIPKNPALLS